MHEQGSRFESPFGGQLPRGKAGLETPLCGRIVGENKRIVFAPPLWYDLLVLMCLVGGVGFAIISMFNGGLQIGNAPMLGFLIGMAVAAAGTWAAFSNERISCDLRSRVYARLEGQSLIKRLSRGSLDQLDALVLVSEEWGLPVTGISRPVVYRLVLHWKGGVEPLLVVESERTMVMGGQPINYRAGAILQRGARYASLLGVTFYDNSYYHSPCPLPAAR